MTSKCPECRDFLEAEEWDRMIGCSTCGGAGYLPEPPPAFDALEARSIIRRVVEDWPYCAPEIIGAERRAMAKWLEENRLAPEAYIEAMRRRIRG